MRILLEVSVRESAFAELAEYRIWDEDGRRILAVVQIPRTDRSHLADALLSLPLLFNQMAQAGVKEIGWKGYIPSGFLRPSSAWLFYGELLRSDLIQAREKALEVAKAAGIRLDPDPAEGRIGMLGELDLAGLLRDSSNTKGDQSVRSRLK